MLRRFLTAAAGTAALVATPTAAQVHTYPQQQTYTAPYGAYQGYPYQGQPYTSGNYRPGAFDQSAQHYGTQGYPYRGQPQTSGNYRPGAFDYRLSPQLASQMCGTAVQSRLDDRRDLPREIARMVGTDGGSIVAVTQAVPKTGHVQVSGIASSELFGPYGVGAYGALGYTQANADLEFRCTVTPRAGVTNVDISRRD